MSWTDQNLEVHLDFFPVYLREKKCRKIIFKMELLVTKFFDSWLLESSESIRLFQ